MDFEHLSAIARPAKRIMSARQKHDPRPAGTLKNVDGAALSAALREKNHPKSVCCCTRLLCFFGFAARAAP